MAFKPGTKAFAAAHAQDVAKRAWSDFTNCAPAEKAAFRAVFDAAEREQSRTHQEWVAAGGGQN